jgi:hypothetical protein
MHSHYTPTGGEGDRCRVQMMKCPLAGMLVSRELFVETLLQCLDMAECKPVSTLIAKETLCCMETEDVLKCYHEDDSRVY